MRKCLILAVLPLLTACYIETNTAWQPVFMPAGGVPEDNFVVIQNMNPPYECRVVAQTDFYPAIYRVVQGPMTRREGFLFVRDVCRAKPGTDAAPRQ